MRIREITPTDVLSFDAEMQIDEVHQLMGENLIGGIASAFDFLEAVKQLRAKK